MLGPHHIRAEYLVGTPRTVVVLLRRWWTDSTLCARLQQSLAWTQPYIKVYGKDHLTPRLQCFVGNADVPSFYYSGTHFPMSSWATADPALRHIRDLIAWDPHLQQALASIGCGPQDLVTNSCLVNYYRDGQDKVGAHSDKNLLGRGQAVLTCSLGHPRTLRFRSKHLTPAQRFDVLLQEGDLLLMAGACQEEWTHEITKVAHAGPRISLTYRIIENNH
jgi:alkylated DNA repair dioxygenase AlkB